MSEKITHEHIDEMLTIRIGHLLRDEDYKM